METQELNSKINAVMMTMFELPEEKFQPDAQLFTDLGLDSLDAIDLMMKFQDEFDVKLSKDDLMTIRTVGDIHSLVQKHFAEKATKH